MTNGSSAARQDLRRRRGLSKLEQGYMGFILILPWLIGFCIFKLYPIRVLGWYTASRITICSRACRMSSVSRNYIDAFTSLRTSRRCK